ncbi:MAG: hypothetical protein U0163_05400 [Gemmatimonadaceae bacterium]
MTAVIERAYEAPTSTAIVGAIPKAEWDALRRVLDEHRKALAEQTEMLRALDARREQLEDLVNDMMPVANDALLLAINKLDAVSKSGVKAWLSDARSALDAVRRAPAPTWRELYKQARTAEARKGLALLLTALRLVGSAATPRATPNNP